MNAQRSMAALDYGRGRGRNENTGNCRYRVEGAVDYFDKSMLENVDLIVSCGD